MAVKAKMIRNNVHRRQLAGEIAGKAGVTADQADKLILLTMKAIEGHLIAGRSVELRGHCTFFMKFSKSRPGRVIKGAEAGKIIHTGDKWVPGFRWADSVIKKATRKAIPKGAGLDL